MSLWQTVYHRYESLVRPLVSVHRLVGVFAFRWVSMILRCKWRTLEQKMVLVRTLIWCTYWPTSLMSRSWPISVRDRQYLCARAARCFVTAPSSTCIEAVTLPVTVANVLFAATWRQTGSTSKHTSSITRQLLTTNYSYHCCSQHVAHVEPAAFHLLKSFFYFLNTVVNYCHANFIILKSIVPDDYCLFTSKV